MKLPPLWVIIKTIQRVMTYTEYFTAIFEKSQTEKALIINGFPKSPTEGYALGMTMSRTPGITGKPNRIAAPPRIPSGVIL